MADRGSIAPSEPVGVPAEVDPGLLNLLAWKLRWSDREHSRRLARRALAIERNDRVQRGLAWRTLAWQARWAGRLDMAEGLSHYALESLSSRSPCEREALAEVLSAIGVLRYSRQQNHEALAAVATGLATLTADDDVEGRIELLVTESTTLRYLGSRERSLESLLEAESLAEGAALGRVRHNLARWYLTDGDIDSALARALPAVSLCRRWDNAVALPYALEVLGACYVRLGRHDRAEACFDEGLRIARRDGDSRVECQILQESGHLALIHGHTSRGQAILSRGLALSRSLGYSLWEAGFGPQASRMLSGRPARRPQAAATTPIRTERRQNRLIMVRAAAPRPSVSPSQIPIAPRPETNPKT